MKHDKACRNWSEISLKIWEGPEKNTFWNMSFPCANSCFLIFLLLHISPRVVVYFQHIFFLMMCNKLVARVPNRRYAVLRRIRNKCIRFKNMQFSWVLRFGYLRSSFAMFKSFTSDFLTGGANSSSFRDFKHGFTRTTTITHQE